MNENTNNDNASVEAAPAREQAPARAVVNTFYEVGGDLLAKPNALCDIIESQGLPSTIVYCNNPSDTDFVEVLLKKRGIGATKLIGYVPPAKLERTIERLASGEIKVVVVTDIAARGLDLNNFPLAVNYSVPQDADLYLLRAGLPSSGTVAGPTTGERVVTNIISPLDIANFHTIKKALTVDVKKADLPTKETLLKTRADNVRRTALDKAASLSEEMKAFGALLVDGADNKTVMAWLLHNTLEVIPQLNASLDKQAWEKEYAEDEGEDRQPGAWGGEREGRPDRRGGRGRGDRQERGDRFDRGDRRRGGRDDRRGGRDDRRGGRRDERRYEDEFEPRSRRDAESFEAGEEQSDERQPAAEAEGQVQERQAEGRGESRREERRERRPREDRREFQPRAREDRIYIGGGSDAGLSEEKLAEIVVSQCGLTREQLTRLSLRKSYSFIDVPEEAGNAVVEKLSETEIEGKKFFVKKAVTISAPREQRESREESMDAGEAPASDEGFEAHEEPVTPESEDQEGGPQTYSPDDE